MVTVQDSSVGLAAESTYNTGVTPTYWPEFVSESLSAGKNTVQGQGLRTGSRVSRSGRRVVVAADPAGDIVVECANKGNGKLWEAALGAGASTLVSGTTYQQVFTIGDTPKSYTIQKGLVRADGTIDPYTFTGAMVNSWAFSLDNQGIAQLTTSWDCAAVSTATSYTTPTALSGLSLYNFHAGTIASGTLTAATTTALASATTTLGNVRSFSLSGNNNLATDRRKNLGSIAKPTVGLREITGSMTVEYSDTTMRNAMTADTELAIVLTLTTPNALSTGVETLQIVIPCLRIDSDIPQANGTDLITTDYSFTVLDNLTTTPLQIVTRTADSAI